MIHKIKAMHSKGSGLSIRAISRELNISRNTVKKYLQMDEQAISILQADPSRYKWLDHYRDYLINLLKEYPKLSAVKLMRRLKNDIVSGRYAAGARIPSARRLIAVSNRG